MNTENKWKMLGCLYKKRLSNGENENLLLTNYKPKL